MVFKPANLVFAVDDSKKMIQFSHLPGEVNALTDPIFDFAQYQTIMVESDLFAFRSHGEEKMLVVQYENVS